MKNLFDIKGKVALVTGASSGLGARFAKALAMHGANVVLAARRAELLEEVKKDVEVFGVKCLAIKCDVGNSDEISSMVNQVKAQFGRIDILVNNAGTSGLSAAETQSDEQWEAMMRINVNGAYYVAREVGRIMIEQQYGKIINLASVCSAYALPDLALSAYTTSKGAVLMLTKSLAVEWAKHNITTNCIAPGFFRSEMTEPTLKDPGFPTTIKTRCPMNRIGNEDELDGALIYFASDASSYTTGQILFIDGGWTSI